MESVRGMVVDLELLRDPGWPIIDGNSLGHGLLEETLYIHILWGIILLESPRWPCRGQVELDSQRCREEEPVEDYYYSRNTK